MLIYFVRHGEDKDDKLTRFGRKQVKMLTKSMKEFKFDNIYSSPYIRCIQTANILKKLVNKEVVIDERIKERFKIKDPKTQNEKEWYDNYLNKKYINTEFETCADFLNRNSNFIDDIIKNNPTQSSVIVVGHSACLYAFLEYFYKNPNNAVVWNSMSNASCIRFEVN